MNLTSQSRATVLILVVFGLHANAEEPTYYQHVRPLLQKHCQVCHNNRDVNEQETSGGLSLETADAIFKSKSKIVVPGKPKDSTLLARLVTSDLNKRMPLEDDPLSAAEIDLVRRWIAAGAKLGTPVKTKVRPVTNVPRKFREVTFPLEVIPPAGYFGDAKPAKLSMVAKLGPLAPVTSVAFSPDGNYLACGSFRRVVIWDLRAGTVKTVLSDPIGMVHDLEFSLDSKFLWLAGGDAAVRGQLVSYDTSNWKPAFEFSESPDVIFDIAMHPNGKQLATVGFDRMLRVFDVSSGEVARAIKAHSDFVYTVAYSRDGKLLATGSKDKTICVWDSATGKQQRTLNGHNESVLALTFSPDGNNVYSSGPDSGIWRWEWKEAQRPRVVRGVARIVHELSWDKAGKELISGDQTGFVGIWNADVGGPTRRMGGNSEVVYSVRLSPDGKIAAAGSWDGRVRIWHVASQQLVMTLVSADRNDEAPADWIAITAKGACAASTSIADRARFVMSGQTVPFDRAQQALLKPADVAKVFRGGPPPAVNFSK